MVFTGIITVFLILLFTACPPAEIDPSIANANYSITGNISFISLNNIQLALPNTMVEVLGSSNSWTVTSDDKGNFRLNGLAPGEYVVKPSRQNWKFVPATLNVVIKDADIQYRNFTGEAAENYILDPWGFIWDAIPRESANWEAANSNCASLGGRLPTPTEIFRNNKSTGSGINFNGTLTSYLWTNIPSFTNTYTIERVSDGTTAQGAIASTYQYRCVWPINDISTFKGSNIYSDPGEPGFTMNIDGKKFVMDTKTRPRLTYYAALREAAFYKAFIPTETMFTAAIRAGLPNGLGISTEEHWHWTSDHEGWNGNGFLNGLVRWAGTSPDFDDTNSTYSSWGYNANGYYHHTRYMGLVEKAEPNPVETADKWVDGNSLLASTTEDYAALSFVDSIDSCLNLGGHLPTHQEMAMLIQAGLPNGANEGLWVSEFHSGDYLGIVKWTGIEPRFTGYYGDNFMSRSDRVASTKHLFRPVFYPIDNSYNGPDSSKGEGGLFTITKGQTKIWTDMYDRTPVTFHEAVKICHDLGGRLATKRDMIELIRSGLPHGYNHWLWTADHADYRSIEVVKWTGVYTGFPDDYGTNADSYQIVNDSTNTTNAFRCVWTNEVRVH